MRYEIHLDDGCCVTEITNLFQTWMFSDVKKATFTRFINEDHSYGDNNNFCDKSLFDASICRWI